MCELSETGAVSCVGKYPGLDSPKDLERGSHWLPIRARGLRPPQSPHQIIGPPFGHYD
jgi:hypothetical protein